MRMVIMLMTTLFCHAAEAPRQYQSDDFYHHLTRAYQPKTISELSYPQLASLVSPSAPDVSDDEGEPRPHQSSPQWEQAVVPSASAPPNPNRNNPDDLLRETLKLRQENQTLEDRLRKMEALLVENNKILQTVLEVLQKNGAVAENLENNQLRLETNVLSLTDKMRQWKEDVMKTKEHPLHTALRYLRLTFNLTATAGTMMSTYYTFAVATSILPAALTPPGWILISTSLATGAIYYILYSV